MLTFLSIITHTAADCLVHNESVRKVTFEATSKMEELAKKHGVKIVGGWNVHPKHLQVMVYEAPNFEAMLAWSAEPEIAKMIGFYTTTIDVAEPLSDMMQRWMQAQ
jgi:hypothetical protein